jgi:hypothetical protein
MWKLKGCGHISNSKAPALLAEDPEFQPWYHILKKEDGLKQSEGKN